MLVSAGVAGRSRVGAVEAFGISGARSGHGFSRLWRVRSAADHHLRAKVSRVLPLPPVGRAPRGGLPGTCSPSPAVACCSVELTIVLCRQFAITAINLVNLLFQLLGWGMRPSASPAKSLLIRMLFTDKDRERAFREGQQWRDAARQQNEERDSILEGEEDEDDEDEKIKRRTMDVFSELFIATFHLFDKGTKVWRTAIIVSSLSLDGQSGKCAMHATWTSPK